MIIDSHAHIMMPPELYRYMADQVSGPRLSRPYFQRIER